MSRVEGCGRCAVAPFGLGELLEADESVESMEKFRVGFDAGAGREGRWLDVELMSGEVGGLRGGEAANMGAETLRWTANGRSKPAFLASSLSTSLLTALLSSSAGLRGTRLAALGERTPFAAQGLGGEVGGGGDDDDAVDDEGGGGDTGRRWWGMCRAREGGLKSRPCTEEAMTSIGAEVCGAARPGLE